ncbi:lipid A 3-O-deacylase PagL [Ulvibacter sp. MAR_2010_11]|uniref:acyloxyacyl hydrolase n=1 Tax=Ulvibacter sp. MAR_2010_11 TaxID=1250229 RepID=UPI000C2C3FD2|nr:acyloxyacyl hydrolase [Ulvibacter sp. MAR_2010_11]PKA84332.1 lipid A 3-O-deacylase PagL [Ulvibacter sp. MAR_2010_11]
MTNKLTYLLLLFTYCLFAQEKEDITNTQDIVITPEVMLGYTPEPNSNFPERNPQTQFGVSLGWNQQDNRQEWAQRLKGPRTGLYFGYTDFGAKDSLGGAFTIMPFIEFAAFKKENLTVQVGTGVSYFTKKYDSLTNFNNQAVSTDLNWSFRVFMYYKFLKTEKIDWRLGGGYSHHSNGHTKLPNQGYNSFLFSVSAVLKNTTLPKNSENEIPSKTFNNTSYSYFSLRSGYGENVLALSFNDKKDIYTFSGEYGKVFNNTWKLGVGMYYRYYEHYYDYIHGNFSLVQDGREFESFKENPGWNASNLGISVNAEVLLNHIGIDLQLGVNLHKPGYKIDWRINQGWDYTPVDIPEWWMVGEFDSKYKMKSLISSRLGLKYYLLGTHTAPKNNLYLGIYINANLGQADYTELSLGYVHSFNFKEKK